MADAEHNTRPGRWLRLALFVSLAINLAVFGAVAGRFLGDGPSMRAPRATDGAVIPYTRALSNDQRRALGRTLRDEVSKRHGKNPRLFSDYREVLDVLRADPFDQGALEQMLTAQGQRADTRRAAGQAVLTSFLAELSPEERRAYADRLELQIERIEESGKKWRKKDGPGK